MNPLFDIKDQIFNQLTSNLSLSDKEAVRSYLERHEGDGSVSEEICRACGGSGERVFSDETSTTIEYCHSCRNGLELLPIRPTLSIDQIMESPKFRTALKRAVEDLERNPS